MCVCVYVRACVHPRTPLRPPNESTRRISIRRCAALPRLCLLSILVNLNWYDECVYMQNTVDSASVATPYNAHYGAEYILKRDAWSAAGMGAMTMQVGVRRGGIRKKNKQNTRTHTHTDTSKPRPRPKQKAAAKREEKTLSQKLRRTRHSSAQLLPPANLYTNTRTHRA